MVLRSSPFTQVDIDSPPELDIVKQIASTPELAALIDEMYFEYHFRFGSGLQFGWGNIDPKRGDTDAALHLFRKLRMQGVRAHFWV